MELIPVPLRPLSGPHAGWLYRGSLIIGYPNDGITQKTVHVTTERMELPPDY